ncbi:MAG: 50S ribosomal protein L18e [Candidatus Nanohaloarchaea archaeon]
MTDVEQKTNPVLKETVKKCEEAGRRNDADVWRRVAEELKKANRDMTEVTVSHIERNSEGGDTVVVPGKVVGSGSIGEDVTVAAFNFTGNALKSIESSGDAIYIDEAVEDNPSGEEVVLLG